MRYTIKYKYRYFGIKGLPWVMPMFVNGCSLIVTSKQQTCAWRGLLREGGFFSRFTHLVKSNQIVANETNFRTLHFRGL